MGLGPTVNSKSEIKKEFLRVAVASRQEPGPEDGKDWRRLKEWLDKLSTPEQPVVRDAARLVNHFYLGADPEFAFVGIDAAAKRAEKLGLKAGLAFGCDQNGRLAELRAAPSRSALSVVVSLYYNLLLIGACYPNTLHYHWRAGAYEGGDGLGGHIHFGRLKNRRVEELEALDQVYFALLTTGVLDATGQQQRQAGDNQRQRYGIPGQYRVQKHGYEYRTLPSWLHSPQGAFVVLTLAKLAVHDPKLFECWEGQGQGRDLVKVLGMYQHLDDDAKLALWSVQTKGWPIFDKQKDIQDEWKIKPAKGKKPEIIPPIVWPTEQARRELVGLLVGEPLAAGEPEISWIGKPPEGWQGLYGKLPWQNLLGSGELLWDAVVPKGTDIIPTIEGSNWGWHVSVAMKDLVAKQRELIERVQVPELGIYNSLDPVAGKKHLAIGISKKWRTGRQMFTARKVLYGGYFPLANIRTATPARLEEIKTLAHPAVGRFTRIIASAG